MDKFRVCLICGKKFSTRSRAAAKTCEGRCAKVNEMNKLKRYNDTHNLFRDIHTGPKKNG